MGRFCALLLAGLSTGAAAHAGLIGAPPEPAAGDCAPFGCVVQYQQLYSSALFSGPITISSLTFYNEEFDPGTIEAGDYTISFSTTSVALDGLSTTFADNLGSDNAVFYSGSLSGSAYPRFTITGTPFAYDPSQGNLLMSVVKDSSGEAFSVYLDLREHFDGFSRVYAWSDGGVAGNRGYGLVTGFNYSGTDLPEPASFGVAAAAIGVLTPLALRRRRSAI